MTEFVIPANAKARLTGICDAEHDKVDVIDLVVIEPVSAFPQAWAYWKVDEASGDRVDSSGNNRTLSPQDGDTSTVVTGKLGDAIKLAVAHVDGFRRETAPDLTDPAQYTFTFWFNAHVGTNPPPTWYFIEYVGDYGLEIYVSSSYNLGVNVGKLSVDVYTPNLNAQTNQTTDPIEPDTWHFCAVYYDGTALRVEVDNELLASDDWDVPGITGPGTYFKFQADSLGVGKGNTISIDEIGVWEVLLTAEQRAQLWNSGNGWSPY